MRIRINDNIAMELLGQHHAEPLFDLTVDNRQFLGKWLPWLELTRSVEDTRTFLQSAIDQYQAGQGPQFALFYNDLLCGVNGFHKIDTFHRIAGIGYWLAEPFTGKGIVTATTRELLRIGFNNYNLHKIEIRCAEENKKSRAVAQRLGFVYESTLRDCEWLYNHYVSHAIYSMLQVEFTVKKKALRQ